LLFIKDRWQQLLLDVNDNQRALIGQERPARDFGLIG
jgi:hypothetical protein